MKFGLSACEIDDGSRALLPRALHFHRAMRGRPRVSRFEAPAWNAEPVRLTAPISASATTCDTDLPRIRFVMDPEIPVIRGTRHVR